jgi:hypothetical protein
MLNIGVPSRRRCNVGSFDYLLGKVHRLPYEIFDPQLLSISQLRVNISFFISAGATKRSTNEHTTNHHDGKAYKQ